MKAILMLEDGKIFPGEMLGAGQERIGEVIFNTAVVGYQEMMTDPANADKILVLTYPLIGNYGIAPKFNESNKAWLSGLVIKEKTRIFSNWQARSSFDEFIKAQNLSVLTGVDTRTLTVHLRNKGQMLGIISGATFDTKELSSKLDGFRKRTPESLLAEISTAKPQLKGKKNAKHKIAILDLGITNSIIRQLETLGVSLCILPYNTAIEEILRLKPHGLVISGGPEGDPGLKEVTENIKRLLGKLPILGISCGHQILAAALGAKITKMKLGHHGVNYPIQRPASYKGEITVQNHSFAVDPESLSKIKDLKITAYNLNDRSIEEMESRKLKILGVQYNPVSPGFDEVNGVFKKFMKIISKE